MPTLELPSNIRDIMPNEIGRFELDCARDNAFYAEGGSAVSDLKSSGFPELHNSHLELYDSTGIINLHNATRSNVPNPYFPRGTSTHHRNLPGEELSCTDKYIAGELLNFHYCNLSSKDN